MSTINKIGVVGSGTMGAALAQKFAQSGMDVVLIDREQRFLDNGMEGIKATLAEGVERRLFRPEQVTDILGRIRTSTNYNDLTDCGLVIEAIFEDLAVKEKLFTELSNTLPEDVILATNTSSFKVSDLAKSVTRPERFIGLHFFYHAAKNRLVEIIRGPATSSEVFDSTRALMQRCGKDPIISGDSHGFIVNRFFVPWLNEAVRMHEENLGTTGAIDSAACKAFRCGMGPFALMNATGVPIAWHAQRTLDVAYGRGYEPAALLAEQAQAGEEWIIADEVTNDDRASNISDRLIGVTLLVCAQLLNEKVCDAGEIHRGARIGLRWGKSPVDMYHQLGEEKVNDLIQSAAQQWGMAEAPSTSPEQWETGCVESHVNGTAGIITINRPEALNALNVQVVEQLSLRFAEFENNSSIDRIVITGQGKAFMAGADIKFFLDHIRGETLDGIVDFTSEGQELYQRIDESNKMVIAVLNGLTLGGGLELALAADFIVALPHAYMAFPETGIGIYPGLGGTQRSVNRVGTEMAKFLIYTGKMLSAKAALEIGLIDQIISWDDLPGLMSGSISPYRPQVKLSEQLTEIAEFFGSHSVDEILKMGESDKTDSMSDSLVKIVKIVGSKAPLALKVAEELIDARAGAASELEHLQYIFSTADALVGLKNVGRPTPEYEGK